MQKKLEMMKLLKKVGYTDCGTSTYNEQNSWRDRRACERTSTCGEFGPGQANLALDKHWDPARSLQLSLLRLSSTHAQERVYRAATSECIPVHESSSRRRRLPNLAMELATLFAHLEDRTVSSRGLHVCVQAERVYISDCLYAMRYHAQSMRRTLFDKKILRNKKFQILVIP